MAEAASAWKRRRAQQALRIVRAMPAHGALDVAARARVTVLPRNTNDATTNDAGSDAGDDAGSDLVDAAAVDGGPSVPTGGACTSSAQCLGTSPVQCLMNLGATPVPGGACASWCRVSHDDTATGDNTDCPVGPSTRATCERSGASTGYCLELCDAGTCSRGGFSGFQGGSGWGVCLPDAESECDPTVMPDTSIVGACIGP